MNWYIIMHMICLVGIPVALVVIARAFIPDDDTIADYTLFGFGDNPPRGISQTDCSNHDGDNGRD